MTKSQRRIRDHELLLSLYRDCGDFAELLIVAGNHERAENIEELRKCVARENVLTRVLNPETTP
jgi:hypothetical protein